MQIEASGITHCAPVVMVYKAKQHDVILSILTRSGDIKTILNIHIFLVEHHLLYTL